MYRFLLWLSKFSCAGSFVHQRSLTVEQIDHKKPSLISSNLKWLLRIFLKDLLWLPWTVWGTTEFNTYLNSCTTNQGPQCWQSISHTKPRPKPYWMWGSVAWLGSILCPKNRRKHLSVFGRKNHPPGMWKPPPQCHGHLPSTSTDWKLPPASPPGHSPPFRLGPCHARMLETSTVLLEPWLDLRLLIAAPMVEITNKNNTEWWDEYQHTSNMYLSGQIIWYFTNMDFSEISLPKRYTFWRAQNSRGFGRYNLTRSSHPVET